MNPSKIFDHVLAFWATCSKNILIYLKFFITMSPTHELVSVSNEFVKVSYELVNVTPWATIATWMDTTRNLVLRDHWICDYMQLSIICNYVISFLELVTILLDLLLFLWLWCNYKIAHPSILTKLLDFSSRNRPLYSFNRKINYNLVTSRYIKHYSLVFMAY